MSAPEDKSSPGVDLLRYMQANGYTEYGSVITEDEILGVLGITVPEYGTREVYNQIQLQILSATGYVRDQLLKSGKAFVSKGGDHRIPLASENAKIIEGYMNQAHGKLTRAIKLQQNMPEAEDKVPPGTTYKLLMQKQAMDKLKRRNRNLN